LLKIDAYFKSIRLSNKKVWWFRPSSIINLRVRISSKEVVDVVIHDFVHQTPLRVLQSLYVAQRQCPWSDTKTQIYVWGRAAHFSVEGVKFVKAQNQELRDKYWEMSGKSYTFWDFFFRWLVLKHSSFPW